ncbi:MAG: hypothetical protein J6X22_00435 [Muribaculaceae bacterium]|nr:hypothetical protein [Muribaculaceae bacterium]
MESIYSKDKYGIVRDRYGNFHIGKYNFRYQGRKPRFDMYGITTKKKGIGVSSYSQWIEQMLPTDYPFEISEEVFNKINIIIRNNVAEVKNILSLQPEQEMRHQLNSKFFIKTDRFFFAHSITFISSTSGSESYDEIRIGENEFLELNYVSTSLTPLFHTNKGESFYLSDFVFDYIKEKTLQTSALLKNLCASIYKPSPLDVPSL